MTAASFDGEKPVGVLKWQAADPVGRAARVAVFTAIGVLLAVGAHRLAGGSAPTAAAVFPAGALLAALGWWQSRRERSGRQLAALMIGTQLGMHLWFVAPALLAVSRASGSGRPSASALAGLLLCHHGPGPVTTAQLTAATRGLDLSSQHIAVGTTPPSAGATSLVGQMLGMMLAHLIAAGVVAWWLRLGERRAWAAVHRVAHGLRFVPRPALPVRARVTPARRARVLASRRWAGALSGRGPPMIPVVSVRA